MIRKLLAFVLILTLCASFLAPLSVVAEDPPIEEPEITLADVLEQMNSILQPDEPITELPHNAE